MCFRNTRDNFGIVAKLFHWVIALLVLIMLAAGISFNYLPKGGFTSTLMFIHKSTGVTILGLMILRLLWRWINPYPQFPDTMWTIEKMAARTVHFLFFIVLIAMPISGILMSLYAGYSVPFWGITTIHFASITKNKALSGLFFNWHGYLAWTIGILIVIHTLAALKHHYYDKDNILKRMWFK